MQNYIEELILVSKTKSLFNAKDKYIVPLYQRAYSWKEKEIEQLIDDIDDSKGKYYLGSLIVHKNGNKYEVIDGQQRLTTLFILFEYLGLSNYGCLSFECRDNSNHTLSHLNKSDLDDSFVELSILNGFKIISQKIEKDIDSKEEFIKKLSNIIIYRIEVPKHTDLNRYFEIMNTRGEQLEQHDILKSQLMNNLNTAKERKAFATIWDACSDMTGYVQMHFPRNIRDDVFNSGWDTYKEDTFKFLSSITEKKKGKESFTVKDALKPSFSIDEVEGINDKDERVRFESIIEFTYFLQHALRVLIAVKNIKNSNQKNDLVNRLMDDKTLLISFKNVIENGQIDGNPIDKHAFSIGYINCLLKCRFLFDKYIIKREYPLNDQEGVWSIKTLHTSGQQGQKKPYYSNTAFHSEKEWEKTYSPRNTMNIMIQSCLRVSYTSPKIMHWITELLVVLYNSNNEYELVNFSDNAVSIARNAVNDDFFKKFIDEYKLGVNTPHIVLNYLDFLIWKNNTKQYSDFVFEFRNSVEHWYPQHPSDGSFEKWEDGVDTFGNLCIIQRNVNSKFSNMAPEAKKSTYEDMIAKGSLKLRIMASMTNSSLEWKNKCCHDHEQKMIKLLKNDLGIGEER